MCRVSGRYGAGQLKCPACGDNKGRETAEMGYFDGIEDAESNQGSNYILPGVYPVVYIAACKMVKSQKGNETFFIGELDIISSKVDDRPAGTSMSWMVNMRHQPALGNIKGFIAQVLGVDEKSVTGPAAEAVVSAANPLAAKLIRLEAIVIETVGNKKPFTKCNWANLPSDVQAKAAELHKAAGFGKDGAEGAFGG